jgi:hypothetical protein
MDRYGLPKLPTLALINFILVLWDLVLIGSFRVSNPSIRVSQDIDV